MLDVDEAGLETGSCAASDLIGVVEGAGVGRILVIDVEECITSDV